MTTAQIIICSICWVLIISEIVYAIVISTKLKRRFNDLNIGSVYAVIYTNKETKNPYLRNSIDWCFQLIDKKQRKGKYYLKYRKYDKYTNTCEKDEYTMEFNMTDKLTLLSQLNNMSIWQRYDNLTDNVSNWLEDLEYITSPYKNDELQDLIKGYKNEIANYKKVLV